MAVVETFEMGGSVVSGTACWVGGPLEEQETGAGFPFCREGAPFLGCPGDSGQGKPAVSSSPRFLGKAHAKAGEEVAVPPGVGGTTHASSAQTHAATLGAISSQDSPFEGCPRCPLGSDFDLITMEEHYVIHSVLNQDSRGGPAVTRHKMRQCLACEEFALLVQAVVQWRHLSAPQPPPPGFKRFSSLSLPKTGFLHVGQAGPERPTSGDSPTSASQSAGITGAQKVPKKPGTAYPNCEGS
ncbi:Histone demethylase UTY [Plecturocebus cupreus]